jgi:hypothetical protein
LFALVAISIYFFFFVVLAPVSNHSVLVVVVFATTSTMLNTVNNFELGKVTLAEPTLFVQHQVKVILDLVVVGAVFVVDPSPVFVAIISKPLFEFIIEALVTVVVFTILHVKLFLTSFTSYSFFFVVVVFFFYRWGVDNSLTFSRRGFELLANR